MSSQSFINTITVTVLSALQHQIQNVACPQSHLSSSLLEQSLPVICKKPPFWYIRPVKTRPVEFDPPPPKAPVPADIVPHT